MNYNTDCRCQILLSAFFAINLFASPRELEVANCDLKISSLVIQKQKSSKITRIDIAGAVCKCIFTH